MHEFPFRPGIDLVHVAGGVYDGTEQRNVMEVLDSMHLTAGKFHAQFEKELAEWFGVRYARLVNSGSSANLLALMSLTSPLMGDRRLQPSDEVITVAAGFPTTVAPIIQAGCVPVFVDITLPACNIDVSMLEAAYSSRTRAVMVAHTLGFPFDVVAVQRFCTRHDLWLIEDCCDAAGAQVADSADVWRKVGTFGDVATLSFYPAHTMTTGEGGAVLTSDPKIMKAVTSLRDWGRDCWCAPACDNTCGRRFEQQHGSLPLGFDHKYTYSHLGYNLKMTDMQAAIGCAQLQKLDSFVNTRITNRAVLGIGLKPVLDRGYLRMQSFSIGSQPSPFGLLLLVEPDAPFTRDKLVRALEARKIQTRMLFAGNMTRQPCMAGHQYRSVGALPNTDIVMRTALWVGVYPGLTKPMLDWMVDSFREVCR